MEKTKYDIGQIFKGSLCTFEMAKKLQSAGITRILCYDEKGELNDGGWLDDVVGSKPSPPAISITEAILLFDDSDIQVDKVNCYELNKKFYLEYEEERYESDNLADTLLEFWLKHKK